MRITEAQVRQIVRRKLGSLTEATLSQIDDTYASHSQEQGHPIMTHLAMGRRILYPTNAGPNTGVYSGVDGGYLSCSAERQSQNMRAACSQT